MLQLWNALEKKFRLYYGDDQTMRCVLLIAKLLFWWIYVEFMSAARRESFVTFFGLEEWPELGLGLFTEAPEPRNLGLDRMDALLSELEEIAATLREQIEGAG